MKPFDPRLLKYAQSTRRFIIEIAVLGLVTAILVIAQAFMISNTISPVITTGADLQKVLPTLLVLGLIVIVRALVVYFRESRAHRAADQAIDQLRREVTQKAVSLGPRWRARHGTETASLLTRGLDDLEPYFVKFLPQLLLTITVTPLALLTILILDFWSALIAFVVIPLIPIFMVLIGRLTQGFSQKKLIAMERLGAQLLDLLTGLPTLRALGREKGPRKHLIELGKQNTHTTMQTLQVAFLSGGVLEFMATLSVALVAVQVGMRMVTGQLSLSVGLVIIMLAPEVFEPLRQVGAQFHASTNGVAAAEECFQILEEDEPAHGTATPPAAGKTPIIINDLSVAARGAWAPHSLSGTIEPGKITALVGPSGSGKSTTVQVLLGFEDATRGAVLIQDSAGNALPIDEVDRETWWQDIAWIPQHPTITPGTVLQNVLAHEDEAPGTEVTPSPSEAVLIAARATGFDAVVNSLPNGWNSVIGFGGIGLSVGQRQRLALTRTLVTRPSLLVLDEPTAHLDAVSESQVVAVLEELKTTGSTILVIAHRNAVVQAADTVLEVEAEAASADDFAAYPQLNDDFELLDLSGTLPGLLDPSALEPVEVDDAHVNLEVRK
ncbi:thiol reductant ABC exporter subunit CydD [Actinomyces minihominis]|uniref:thiol reductant ABC exporter subunit CydD n=1 Tax=Actinomyces minihominis TaxID=2002838 RepID=UPI000C068F30|nr:thiol reductant ABC exporter subunit CydD [Actinomyces minihominis]